MMYTPLKITTDYSLLKSLIKIEDLIKFLVKNNITSCGICDENLYGTLDFYTKCKKNNIKPIIGLNIKLNSKDIYLYAKNYNGYKNLLKIHTLMHKRELGIIDLELYKSDILVIVPYKSNIEFKNLLFFHDLYIGYTTEFEKTNALFITKNIVYVNDILSLNLSDTAYLLYLDLLGNRETLDYSNNYYKTNLEIINESEIKEVVDKLNLEIPFNNRYIPKFNLEVDSYNYLYSLAFKGLSKRLNGKVIDTYTKRLNYELNVIKSMNFVDYFLIVYDYVLYAKKNNILVGPGRGSAAGSLVSFCIGITDIDPIKYNLIFERFLNPARVTMPDIDIDFDATKRDLVIDYVKGKYGSDFVASGITFNTLKSKLVLREVAKLLKVDNALLEGFIKSIDSSLDLRSNLQNVNVKKYLTNYKELNKLYEVSLKLEGLKKNVSTHAAGVVISSVPLDDVIPIYINNDTILTGSPMEYLEDMGLLKMDFLGLKNLTIIANILDKIGIDKLKNINLEDPRVFDLFLRKDVDGIFQFESPVMRMLLDNFVPDSFSDLVASVALVRPGPRKYVPTFIKRKDGLEKITYLHPDLEDILKETYGVLLYQEQIISVLVKIGGYSLGEADIIRRAISKKNESIILEEEKKFVASSIKNGYQENFARTLYKQISEFASYGFNKSHSVAYALISYQMAYLKVYYPAYFVVELLNTASKDTKTNNYLALLKRNNIKLEYPSVLNKNLDYEIYIDKLLLPLNVIKNINTELTKQIISVNEDGFKDYFDFLCKTKEFLNEKTITTLIHGGALDFLHLNHQTLINNLENALNYASLVEGDDTLIKKPTIVEYNEYNSDFLREKEIEAFGFFISNHPASKYLDGVMKLCDMKKYLFKKVKCIVLIESIKRIKTKKNDDMAFFTASDETSTGEFTVFPKDYKMLDEIKNFDLVLIDGEVTKRFDKYQIIVNNIKKRVEKNE
ncbi:MAG: DNA polymerase III subunit alpha [Bacilli bacterium]